MAVDEAILEASGRGQSPPTLRLYAWDPGCLSLGYAQPFSDVSMPELTARGWDLVRRPTGGRAILHIDELTYSVAGPLDEPRLAGGVLESYHRLSLALLGGLKRMGILAKAQPQKSASTENDSSTSNDMNPVCFEVPSNYEITIQGKKLIGSAQARRKGGVLQHGSLPLYGDLTRITQVLSFQNPEERAHAAQRLSLRAITSEQILNSPPAWREVADALVAAFQEKLNLELQLMDLTPAEYERAAQLHDEKYTAPSWTKRI